MRSTDIGEGIIASWSDDRTLTLALASNPEVFIILSPYAQSALDTFVLECLKDYLPPTHPIHAKSPQQSDSPV